MSKLPQPIEKAILSRIYGHGRGWVFTPAHFSDLASRNTINSALKRHKDAGKIRQLSRGLYDYPRRHRNLGFLAPSAENVARALAGRDAVKLQPTGAYAANSLGLSQQVPMKVTFLTDGPSRRLRLGAQEIILKRTTPRNMAYAGTTAGLVIQAVRYVGEPNITPETLQMLRQKLSEADKKQLHQSVRHTPSWVANIIRQIVNGAPSSRRE